MSNWTKLGAFWKKISKSGKKFLAGEITIDGTKTKITCWPNDKGGNEKRPDFVIYLSEDQSVPKSQVQDEEEVAPEDEDLPF
jgi:uncharacterized protein (DUF736 family)